MNRSERGTDAQTFNTTAHRGEKRAIPGDAPYTCTFFFHHSQVKTVFWFSKKIF